MSYVQAIAALSAEITHDRAALQEKEELLAGLERLQVRRSQTVQAAAPEATTVRKSSNQHQEFGSNRTGSSGSKAHSAGNLNAAVVSVLKAAAAPLTTGDIYTRVAGAGYEFTGKYPRQRVSNVLDQLVEAGTVARTETGRGRSPHMYSVV